MPVESVLLAVYAVLLLGIAAGLQALGRRSTSPYASRTLAGHVRATGDVPEISGEDWPHNEAPRLYAGMGLTAALASLVLSGAGVALHHEPVTVVLLLVVAVLAGLTAARLGGSLRRT